MKRNHKVEMAILEVLNTLLKNESVTLHYASLVTIPNTVTLMANLPKHQESVHIMTLWPERPDTYILCVGTERGLYLRWKGENNKILIALNIEMDEKPDYCETQYAWMSLPFIIIANKLVRETTYRYHRLSFPKPQKIY